MAKRKKAMRTTKPSGAESANKTIIDIDYEKLADCVAKAIAEESDRRINAQSITREWMKFIIAPVFWGISVLTAILAAGFAINGASTFNSWSQNTTDIQSAVEGFISFVLALICIGIALPAFWAGKEFDQEKDRQFVVSVFSGMLSLVALIVAIIALVIK